MYFREQAILRTAQEQPFPVQLILFHYRNACTVFSRYTAAQAWPDIRGHCIGFRKANDVHDDCRPLWLPFSEYGGCCELSRAGAPNAQPLFRVSSLAWYFSPKPRRHTAWAIRISIIARTHASLAASSSSCANIRDFLGAHILLQANFEHLRWHFWYQLLSHVFWKNTTDPTSTRLYSHNFSMAPLTLRLDTSRAIIRLCNQGAYSLKIGPAQTTSRLLALSHCGHFEQASSQMAGGQLLQLTEVHILRAGMPSNGPLSTQTKRRTFSAKPQTNLLSFETQFTSVLYFKKHLYILDWSAWDEAETQIACVSHL